MSAPRGWTSVDYAALAGVIAAKLNYEHAKMEDENIVFDMIVECQKEVIPEEKWKTKFKIPATVSDKLMVALFKIKKPVEPIDSDHVDVPGSIEDTVRLVREMNNRLTKQEGETRTIAKGMDTLDSRIKNQDNHILEYTSKMDQSVTSIVNNSRNTATALSKTIEAVGKDVAAVSKKNNEQQTRLVGLVEILQKENTTLKEANKELMETITSALNNLTDVNHLLKHYDRRFLQLEQVLGIKSEDVLPIAKISAGIKEATKEVPAVSTGLIAPKVHMVLIGTHSKLQVGLKQTHSKYFEFDIISKNIGPLEVAEYCKGKHVLVCNGGTSSIVISKVKEVALSSIFIPANKGVSFIRMELDKILTLKP